MIAIAACSRDPKVQAQRFVAAGDAYVAQHKYKEAILEYRNAITAQPSRADVHYKLARAYMANRRSPSKRTGRTRRRPISTRPIVDAQLQSGELLLMAGAVRRSPGARRARAENRSKSARGTSCSGTLCPD